MIQRDLFFAGFSSLLGKLTLEGTKKSISFCPPSSEFIVLRLKHSAGLDCTSERFVEKTTKLRSVWWHEAFNFSPHMESSNWFDDLCDWKRAAKNEFIIIMSRTLSNAVANLCIMSFWYLKWFRFFCRNASSLIKSLLCYLRTRSNYGIIDDFARTMRFCVMQPN